MRKTFRLRNGGSITYQGPTVATQDAARRLRDGEEENPEYEAEDPRERVTAEVTRRSPELTKLIEKRREELRRRASENRDDESEQEGEVIARYPAHCTAQHEDGELVIRSGSSPTETDLYDMNNQRKPARDWRRNPPKTLAAMNQFLASHYQRPRKMAVR